jgi:CBS domain-containing protein
MQKPNNLSLTATPIRLIMSQRVDFLARLRTARGLVLRDSESFSEASTVLEHIGQVVGGKLGIGLKDHEAVLIGLVKEADAANEEPTRRLFKVVREARNKAVHDGSYARHLNSRLVDLLLMLEETIMTNMDRVEDLMVRNPVSAESWHPVSQVRRLMLGNSFTWIPIFHAKESHGRWMLIRDAALMRWIRKETVKKKQRERLAIPIGEAISKHGLELKGAICCPPDTPIAEILQRMNDDPTLVTDKILGEERLLGIITAFDLL